MSQRYQREIEEILDQVNAEAPAEKGGRPVRSPADQASPPRRSRGGRRGLLSLIPIGISPGRLLLTGIVLLLAAMVLRSAIPGIAGPLTWTGVGLFIAAYVIFFTRPRRSIERRWRGRSIEDGPPSGRRNPLERLWRWVNRD